MKAVSRILWLSTVSILVVAHDAVAQSANELARQTQNPVASLISVPLQANWDVGVGTREGAGRYIASPGGGADWRLRIQANFLFPR